MDNDKSRATGYWWGRYDETMPARRDRRWRDRHRRHRITAPRVSLSMRIMRALGSLVGVS